MEREKAQMGVFITLNPPIKDMKTEAVSSGFYKSGWYKDCPRIQILTIDELLEGKGIDYPPKTSATFKKAKKHKVDESEQLVIEESDKD